MRKMNRTLALVFAVSLVSTAGAQTSPSVQSAEIVEYGIYRIALSGGHIPLSSTSAGAVEPATGVHLIATTNRVPAVVGTTFGCLFVVKGEPTAAPVTLDIVVEHPPFQKAPGDKTGTRDKVPWPYVIGQKSGYTYTLDNDWEAVPGNWSIQVCYRGRKLAEQKFVVEAKKE
jgi:hypothetical protein